MTHRDQLRTLITELAVVRGRVTLSSGRRPTGISTCAGWRCTTSAAPLIGRVMLDLTADWSYEAVGGLTLGADPVAMAMLHASAASAGQPIDAFIVRKEGKAHGLQRRIEGPDVAGRRVLALEDTSTTGSSVLTAVDALREAGAEVAGVAVVVDRGAGDAIRAAGLAYRAAYDLVDLGLA